MQILSPGREYTRESEFICDEGESYFWQSFMYALVYVLVPDKNGHHNQVLSLLLFFSEEEVFWACFKPSLSNFQV